MVPDEWSRMQFVMWGLALNQLPHVYEGTVPHHVKARRRAADKVARRSRRINRGLRSTGGRPRR